MAAYWHTMGTLLKIRLMASNEIMKGAGKLKHHFTRVSRVWGWPKPHLALPNHQPPQRVQLLFTNKTYNITHFGVFASI